MIRCRLCSSLALSFFEHNHRNYERCTHCSLIQLRRSQCPKLEEEKSEYMLHNNDPYDPRYRRFLRGVTQAMIQWLLEEQRVSPNILDFGSGSGPAISVVLGEQGWNVHNYDPLYSPDKKHIQRKYDLISSTEVVEHFYEPKISWELLFSLLKEDGCLVVMTQSSDRYCTSESFGRWRYIREKSHVALYHTKTMQWLAQHYDMQLSILSPNIFWFAKEINPNEDSLS